VRLEITQCRINFQRFQGRHFTDPKQTLALYLQSLRAAFVVRGWALII
jgi:hypothetical protein